uniref:Uncharacterized protein n=1 Tax=Arundo donax TaxID=35708 RepID=A0A0A8Y9N0_ARUDO
MGQHGQTKVQQKQRANYFFCCI